MTDSLACLSPRHKTLFRLAARLVRKGWLQGKMLDLRARRYCLIGALLRAAKIKGIRDGDVCFLALQERLGTARLSEWNDAPSRSQAEVAAVLMELSR